jgi:hypothetical protein
MPIVNYGKNDLFYCVVPESSTNNINPLKRVFFIRLNEKMSHEYSQSLGDVL